MGRHAKRATKRPLSTADCVAQLLADILSNSRRRKTKRRMVHITPLPFCTEEKFQGFPLRRVMAPNVPDDGYGTEHWFDVFMSTTSDANLDPIEALIDVSSKNMGRFVSVGDTVGEQALRLLFALSTAPGAKCTYDSTSFMIEHGPREYGIRDGVVVSRFSSGILCPCNPNVVMEQQREVRVFNPSFAELYVEAHVQDQGRNVARALEALYVGRPGYNFRRMLLTPAQRPSPTDASKRYWEKLLFETLDPVGKLYAQLVPRWMGESDFNRIIISLEKRDLDPDNSLRQDYLTRLNGYFHTQKNKKETT